jgi:hypothetical protein
MASRSTLRMGPGGFFCTDVMLVFSTSPVSADFMARRAFDCRRRYTARPVMPTKVTTQPVSRTFPRVSDVQTRSREAVTPPRSPAEAVAMRRRQSQI